MPGKTVGISMNAGYPGTFARNADCIIANKIIKATDSAGPDFGDTVAINDDNTFSKFGAAHALADFYGIAVREVKTPVSFSTQDPTGNYAPGQPCDVINRGSVSVKCCVGTPKSNGKVYVRTVLGSPATSGSVVGGLEAADATDGGTCIELTNCEWGNGYMDANKVTELVIKTRN